MTPIGARLRGLLTAPAEGWTTLVAVVVLMVVAAAGIDNSKWIGYVAGSKTDTQTAFLPILIAIATLVGYVLARTRLSPVRAHILGALIGTALLLFFASGAVSAMPSLELRLHALANSVATFITDVTVRGIRSGETSIFALLVGGLLWAAGQLGAFALFRRHRAGPAIGLAATALLINMSITAAEELYYLLVLVGAALLLIVRTSLFTQVEQWRSRHIADTTYATQLFVRSGAIFVSVALLLSYVLATNAASAPLRPMWDGAMDRLVEVGVEVNHFLGGVSGPARGPNLLFTPSQTIRDQWETSSEPVFTAITGDGFGYYWRGATYDYFDGRSWQHIVGTEVGVPAFEDLQGGQVDAGMSKGRHDVVAEITSINLNGRVIVAPADAVRINQNAIAQLNSSGGLLDIKIDEELVACPSAAIRTGEENTICPDGSSYNVTSRVFDTIGSAQLTVSDLAGAGRNYGAALKAYVDIQPNAIGPLTRSVADNLVNQLDPRDRDPYHIAKAMYDYFRSGRFEYQADVRGMCSGDNLIDCFLRERQGYCEYFASAMTMMLRTQQIPARYVVGYLPGKRQDDGSFLIQRSASHAWVEVFFPGYGWYRFDPTPGLTQEGQQDSTNIPPGPARPTLAPDKTPEAPIFGSPPPDDGGLVDQPTNPSPKTPGLPPPLAVGIFLGVLGVAVLLVVLARRRKLPGSGQMTYDSVARIASRFGYGPTPAQTAYEYADTLSAIVPTVRDDLRVVATAKVEATYARREPSDELKLRLLMAYRRVRMSLVRLFFRRPMWVARRFDRTRT